MLSKRLVIIFTLILAVAVALSGALAAEKFGRPLSDKMLAQKKNIIKAIEDITGRKFKREVVTRFITREEQKKKIKEMLKEVSEDEQRETELYLKRFGLLDDKIDLFESLVKMYTQMPAGYYDPRLNELYLLRENFGVFMHEMVHALQDQTFIILDQKFEFNDKQLVLMCLAEGEATAVPQEVGARRRGKSLGTIDPIPMGLRRMLSSKRIPKDVPRFIVLRQMMCYRIGLCFVQQALLRRGNDWKNIENLVKEPPESTEQILHPDKYFGMRDYPVKLRIADFAKDLGEDWKLVTRDTFGELFMNILLSELVSVDKAIEASAGWDGDSLQIYMNKNTGRVVLAWATTWDSEKDAGEFARTYTEHLKARTKSDSDTVDDESTNKYRYTQQEGKYFSRVEQSGKDVTIIENASAGEFQTIAKHLGELERIEVRSGKYPKPSTDLPELVEPVTPDPGPDKRWR